jgi:hypothetical protein
MRECEDTDRQVNDRSNADGGNDRADVVEREDSYQPIRGELHLLYWSALRTAGDLFHSISNAVLLI